MSPGISESVFLNQQEKTIDPKSTFHPLLLDFVLVTMATGTGNEKAQYIFLLPLTNFFLDKLVWHNYQNEKYLCSA